MKELSYSTPDTYMAAALILSSRNYDEIYTDVTGRQIKVYFKWTSRKDLPIQEYISGKLKIEPLAFKNTHRDLTIQCLKIINQIKSERNNYVR